MFIYQILKNVEKEEDETDVVSNDPIQLAERCCAAGQLSAQVGFWVSWCTESRFPLPSCLRALVLPGGVGLVVDSEETGQRR